MSGKKPPVNSLELRKQLLIAESEINRAQLRQEWRAVTDGVRCVADRAKTLGSFASAAAALMAGLVAFRRSKAPPDTGKSSWVRTVLKALRLAGSIWLAFRPRGRDED